MIAIYNRYCDLDQLITDSKELRITNRTEVILSLSDNYDIVVDLEDHLEQFDEWRPFIALIAQNLCKLDNMAQTFNRIHRKEDRFPFDLEVIYLEDPAIVKLDYWGTEVNTQFTVTFVYRNQEFVLKSFGMIEEIPDDWYKED